MDRNWRCSGAGPAGCCVALRKESVDRNIGQACARQHRGASLSARRAWIEIKLPAPEDQVATVALRKESVDRNWASETKSVPTARSLSARRAWIEILAAAQLAVLLVVVALRKESVDRNAD